MTLRRLDWHTLTQYIGNVFISNGDSPLCKMDFGGNQLRPPYFIFLKGCFPPPFAYPVHTKVLRWMNMSQLQKLKQARQTRSEMVDTQDSRKDHSEHAEWVGFPLTVRQQIVKIIRKQIKRTMASQRRREHTVTPLCSLLRRVAC